MTIVRDADFVRSSDRGAAAAIGNFDGVHLGHRSVIDQTGAAARRLHAPLGVLTFEPHPREFFAPDAPPFRLMSAEAKAHRLEKLGVDILYQLSFNQALASLSAEEFAQAILADKLGLRHVIVGSDFCFGKGRTGTARMLQEFGQAMGFGVTVAELLRDTDQTVSSTSIRTALTEGRPEDAARMLGHWHRIEGPVVHGEKRGRELGYPTANMSIDGLHPPRFGVYAVLVDVLEGRFQGRYRGVASMGVRPMFGENRPNLETFLFDFSGDLYGTQISVALVSYIRPEVKFEGLQALIAQMDKDSEEARHRLADATS
ncbi:bifunctional riboflavin kinase/FAD synthetase [Tropicimonas sp. S265A]|uniref:bifunctional riboflavin kinase/FAD synthetase n=1 Tax=Tropicimonas sp. S265A TaxID=3415134 RepID=UPI003C7A7B87